MLGLNRRAWSPYVAGGVIGLLQIPAFILLGTALGASSSYVTVAGSIAAFFDPAIARIDYVARHLAGAKNWWQVALVVGIALGAMLSARWSATTRHGTAAVWRSMLGPDADRIRPAMAFAGGFLMVFGARVADGCTSGHGISGMAQLAVGSTVAVAAMFAGGIAAAAVMPRR